jgi:transcription elongation GreA/GreB family factor
MTLTELISARELMQLASGGNTNAVEEAWMQIAESPGATPAKLCEYAPIVGTLAKAQNQTLAETLTSTLVEGVKERLNAEEVILVAGACLRAIGNSDELRAQVSELYRAHFGSRDGFEALLTEAGLPSGRPVRRALRTLDVCLSIEQGSFLAGRDEDEAAQVESVDVSDWTYTVKTDDGTEELGAVLLADRFRPADEGEFAVQKQFDAKGLAERMAKHPDTVVIALCRENGNTLDSDQLMDLLCPSVIAEDDFKKWWTKARAAVKKCPQIRLEGRSPYTITYDDAPISVEQTMLENFNRHRDPLDRYGIVTKYIQGCPGRGADVDKETILDCYGTFSKQAQALIDAKQTSACVVSAMAAHLGEVGGADEPVALPRAAVIASEDLDAAAKHTGDAGLLERIVNAIEATRPESWKEDVIGLIPNFPQSYLDRAVERLTGAGVSFADLAPKIQQILKAPSDHFEAMLWLWNGPAKSELLEGTPLATVMTRILRALNEARVSDRISREQAKTMAQRARNVLSARKYERFNECVDTLDGGMALALKTQLTQADNLGPAARDAMLRKLQPILPVVESGPALPTWAMDDVLYATESGIAKKDAEIEHHVNVKIKENAKAIGEAAEKGDLSENSEYKFALEERDLLRGRLAQMNSERASARVLSTENIPTDHVGIGTRVVFKNVDTAECYEMTFIGPWEADIDKGIFNYRAPLAQEIMGRTVGDIVEFDHSGQSGTFKIIELHNALEDGTLETLQRS